MYALESTMDPSAAILVFFFGDFRSHIQRRTRKRLQRCRVERHPGLDKAIACARRGGHLEA